MTIDEVKPGTTISWPDGRVVTVVRVDPDAGVHQILVRTRHPTDTESLAAKLGLPDVELLTNTAHCLCYSPVLLNPKGECFWIVLPEE